MKAIDQILSKLAELVTQGRYEALETEALEIKSVPPDTGSWRELHRVVNAFLNTRGGIIILGVKEEGQGPARRYVFTGYREEVEPKLKEIRQQFTDREDRPLDLPEMYVEIRDFAGGRIALLYVDELPEDRKYCFYQGVVYRRSMTGEHRVSEGDIEAQEEYKEEALHAKELSPVPGVTPDQLDLDKLNDYIQQLNRVVRVESVKPTLEAALSFLERKFFVRNGKVTTLGMLVCGRHPEDALGFRSHVHGYVDAPADTPMEIALDKQDIVDNVLPLMEESLRYVLRNIRVGVSVSEGGTSQPQYPEDLLRETVNNALAHRDYRKDRQVIIAIKPSVHIAIRNPGTFRKTLVIEILDNAIPLRRIIPEPKPRNPRLADVLRVYRKWEGRGIGMATLVNLCLEDRIDIPYYRFYTEEVCLFLQCGRLLDEGMERLFQSFDGYIEDKMGGGTLSESQKRVLAYLIKSERVNQRHGYTILLAPDNNHFSELRALEKAQLDTVHPSSPPLYPVYVADRTLMAENYVNELRQTYGPAFDSLDPLLKDVLNVVYRFNTYSKTPAPGARQVCFALWSRQEEGRGDVRRFDAFDRRVRNAFTKLEKAGFVQRTGGKPRYVLNKDLKREILPL